MIVLQLEVGGVHCVMVQQVDMHFQKDIAEVCTRMSVWKFSKYPVNPTFSQSIICSIGMVIDWLMEKDELQRPYNFLKDNSQHFAQRLFETVAKTKKYPDKFQTTKAILDSSNTR